jgi:hypothetical protein
MANPIELNYQVERQVYCFRSALTSLTAKFFNTATEQYENYVAGNWADYALMVPEVTPGYYRIAGADIPAASLAVPATELFYEAYDTEVGPQLSDAPSIGQGNSQGVDISTVDGNPPVEVFPNPSAAADICNLALQHLGQKAITALTDETESARRCLRIYASTRDAVLRDASWGFAAVIDSLVLLSSESIPGWGYVFEYPATCVFIKKVYSGYYSDLEETVGALPVGNPENEPFKVVYLPDLNQKVIVTNFSPAYIEYTARVDDPDIYDQLFVKAFAYRLASELANILTGKEKTAQEMMQNYLVTISEAQKVNGIEDNVPDRKKCTFIEAR